MGAERKAKKPFSATLEFGLRHIKLNTMLVMNKLLVILNGRGEGGNLQSSGVAQPLLIEQKHALLIHHIGS